MFFENSNSIILASASPRRRELLSTIGLKFEVVPPHINEEMLAGETPKEYVARLSKAKATAIGKKFVNYWILGADTIVSIDGEVLEKPRTEAEAYSMLRKLSGREHRVLTGFFIYHTRNQKSFGDVVESWVKIKRLEEEEIRAYINTGEPFDKAGAYAAQGQGMFMIEKISGSFTNVIGLPVCEVINAFRELGAIKFWFG
ncbi:MAG: Maf family protein [Desulfobacterota bacterium]|nr:Maf family protein [Thermodesulfobacteriota bacterium]